MQTSNACSAARADPENGPLLEALPQAVAWRLHSKSALLPAAAPDSCFARGKGALAARKFDPADVVADRRRRDCVRLLWSCWRHLPQNLRCLGLEIDAGIPPLELDASLVLSWAAFSARSCAGVIGRGRTSVCLLGRHSHRFHSSARHSDLHLDARVWRGSELPTKQQGGQGVGCTSGSPQLRPQTTWRVSWPNIKCCLSEPSTVCSLHSCYSCIAFQQRAMYLTREVPPSKPESLPRPTITDCGIVVSVA